MEATTATALATKFIIKAWIGITQGDEHNYRIGSISIPSNIIIVDNFPVLQLVRPWRFDPGDRVIDGLEGFQRRISSADPDEVRCFFIPTSYLLRVEGD
jgi:hypothetical protein